MGDENPYDKKTQPQLWQQWLNARIAEHDAKQKNSSDEGQNFEINPKDK